MKFHSDLEPLADHTGGDAVGVVFDRYRAQRPESGAIVIGTLGGAVGGVVGEFVVVAGDAVEGGGHGMQPGVGLDVRVGQLVNRSTHSVSFSSARTS